jgi:hypothetical protein
MKGKNEIKRTPSVSLLLGAGFSVPMGYPAGSQMNERILNCNGNGIKFSDAGELSIYTDGEEHDDDKHPNPYDWYFIFCRDVIQYYNENIKAFDYEEFYDYLKGEAIEDEKLREMFDSGSYSKSEFDNFEHYIHSIDNIYNQLVSFYLRDGENRNCYDKLDEKELASYKVFLDSIERLMKCHVINVHTLNHDLFFESLKNTKWINRKLCDGFEKTGSPYYARCDSPHRSYMRHLSYYTGKYDARIRLYKLHGSLDYYIFSQDGPPVRIKGQKFIDETTFIKKVRQNGVYKDIPDITNYHPDFLTGTTAKIKRYKEPFYKDLIRIFKQNLKDADKLIIIGYGCKDEKINEYIKEEFDCNKPCYIINPPNDSIKAFATEMGGRTKLICKKIEELSISDLK